MTSTRKLTWFEKQKIRKKNPFFRLLNRSFSFRLLIASAISLGILGAVHRFEVCHAKNYSSDCLAANLGDIEVVKYLISKGADLAAHDLGKKNDGAFGSSVEPLMPIDYAIGVGTFVPNNAVIIHHDVLQYMAEEMKKRGIVHTTSECTLRGFTCALANVDPKTATPAEIVKIRTIQTGYQVDGLTGGLGDKAQR